MGYYSDPTAAKALGEINREFSRLEKRARNIRKRMDEGTMSPKALDKAQGEFKGLYRHVLTLALEKERENTER